jgi:hypothetical protein
VIGAGDELVAEFEPLVISGPADASSGCHQVLSRIPPGMLGPGVYRFDVEMLLGGEGPLLRRAAFAVD